MTEDSSDQVSTNPSLRDAYNISAVIIFVVMAYTFLFPCNKLIPLDRRTVAVLCAVLCYITRTYAFHGRSMNMLEAVDWDVLVLLASIMAINYLVVHLRETKRVILYLQNIIQLQPRHGFWMTSIASLLISPFLTNDGVCLLFVEPILNAFEGLMDQENDEKLVTLTMQETDPGTSDPILLPSAPPSSGSSSTSVSAKHRRTDSKLSQVSNASSKIAAPMIETPPQAAAAAAQPPASKLDREDAVYFMLTLACSSNIGSALTYTGNPQNMIVADDAISVMPPYMFTLYMLAPVLFAWLVTTLWIEYCWMQRRDALRKQRLQEANEELTVFIPSDSPLKQDTSIINPVASPSNNKSSSWNIFSSSKKSSTTQMNSPSSGPFSPMSPRRRKQSQAKKQGSEIFDNVVYIVTSPVPYLVLIILAAMIVLIFVDVMSISGLVCVTAIVMIVSVVVGNHWRGQLIWAPDNEMSKISNSNKYGALANGMSDESQDYQRQPLTDEEKIDNMNEFFEGLFNSLDYSLLFIFLGTFIVVANVDSTGLPKYIWDRIVGTVPFKTVGSVIGISLFVLVASQFLGNVAIIQLAKPNIESLGDNEKKYAWAVISYVATVGGNLTITGSAANIIVSEKSARIDPDSSIDFFRHFRVCFVVTLISCAVGSLILTMILMAESQSA